MVIMKLIVVSDKNQISASKRLIDEIIGLDEDVILFSPENSTLITEKMLVKKAVENAVCGISVTNFSRLFSQLFPSYKVATNEFSSMLISKIIRENKMIAFQKSSKKIGFAHNVQKLLSIIRESDVNLDNINLKDDNALDCKLIDLAMIQNQYKKLCSSKIYDAIDQKKLITERIKSGFFKDKCVGFVGYDDLSATSLSLVEEIIKTAKCVFVSVKEFDNQQLVNSSLCDEFLEIANKLCCNVVFKRQNSLKGRALLIAENLYSKQRKAMECDGVKIVRCKNRFEEIKFVLDNICEKVRGGARYNDFEVIVPDIELYNAKIKERFSKFGIPLFVDAPKSIRQNPLFVLIEKFLLLGTNKRSVKSLVSFSKNILLKNDINEISLYENFCEKHGIEFEDVESPIVVGMDDLDFETICKVHRILQNYITLLPKDNSCVDQYISTIKDFIEKFNILDELEKFLTLQDNKQEQILSKACFEKLNNLFEEIKNVFNCDVISLQEFIEIWQSGVEAIRVKTVPPTLDMVYLTDISTSKHIPRKYYYILNAIDGDFPTLIADNGILTDKELFEISNRFDKKIGPTTERVNELEKLKVSELLQLAEKEIIITYPQKVLGERKELASPIRALKEICLKNGLPIQEETIDTNTINEFRQLKERAKCKTGAREVMSILNDRLKHHHMLGLNLELLDAVSSILKKEKEIESPNKEFETSKFDAKKLFFASNKTSISQIETYYTCPYLHYVKYGLRIKEKELAKIKALDIGNFLHKCLEVFTNELLKEKFAMTDDSFAKTMKDVLSIVLTEEKYNIKVNKLQIEALKNEACRLCYAVLKGVEGSGFKPKCAELNFGINGLLPAVSLDKSDIVVEGKIDRMDVCNNLVRLIDYKTGQIDLDLSNLYYGKKIQLFVYLLAVLNKKELRPAGVFYLPIKSIFRKDSDLLESYKLLGYFSKNIDVINELDYNMSLDNPKSNLVDMALSTSKENRILGKKVLKNTGNAFDENELVELADYAKMLIEQAVFEINSGEIEATPLEISGSRPCDYCQFKAACKIDKNFESVRIQAKKVGLVDILEAKKNGFHK